jgi:protoporphyrinogen oxidase
MTHVCNEVSRGGIDATSTRRSYPKPRVAILGGGPAGIAAALSLARSRNADVTLLELRDSVGGNAGSFMIDGIWCDHGSHRFHPVAEPRVMDEVKSLLGDDLLWRPRHGRILLQNRWIHFPLKPFDLLSRLPGRFTAALAMDAVSKSIRSRPASDENFSTVLRRGLGPTICDSFYYPYVRKLWGLEPEQLAVTLAQRRVSGSSISKMLRKVARQIPGFKSERAGGFYYPKKGFGQISERLYESAVHHGAHFVLGAEINGITAEGGHVSQVTYKKDGETHTLAADAVWSTLPIGMLVRMIEPSAPRNVLEAAKSIRFRGMILIYLVLEQQQFTEYDAHYFPETAIPISRMSEPKNYTGSLEPRNRTVLCAELPSDPCEAEWALSDQELGQRLCDWLKNVGLPVRARVDKVMTRRLKHAYPVYDRDYESHFNAMDEWLSNIDGLLTLGRQGLFAHDNTHHAITMAFAAADCLGSDGQFDRGRWAACRQEFKSHVVED